MELRNLKLKPYQYALMTEEDVDNSLRFDLAYAILYVLYSSICF